jgi:hypothetical protein
MSGLLVTEIPTFDDLRRKLTQIVDEATQAQINRLVARIEKNIAKVNRTFFRVLVKAAIDVAHEPGDGIATSPWAALDAFYQARKGKEGHSENFLSRTGKLETSLLGKSTVSVFGEPQITVNAGTFYRTADGKTYKTGQVSAAGNRNSAARFEVTVNAFPKFSKLGPTSAIARGVVERLLYNPSDRSRNFMKLTNRVIQVRGADRKIRDRRHSKGFRVEKTFTASSRYRPFLVGFLVFWLETEIEAAILDALAEVT